MPSPPQSEMGNCQVVHHVHPLGKHSQDPFSSIRPHSSQQQAPLPAEPPLMWANPKTPSRESLLPTPFLLPSYCIFPACTLKFMGCIVPFLAIKSQGFRALEINYFFQKDCLLQIENLSFQKIVSALSFKNQEFDTLLLCAPTRA